MIALAAPKQISGKQLQSSIRLGAFILVFLSAVALLLTQRLLLSSMILATATVIAWPAGKKLSREKFWEIASLIYLGFFLLDVFFFSPGLAQALVHLFVFILINKLFNLRNTRDYYQLYLLSFLCMLAASSLSVEIEIFYLILIYIVLFLWNIASMTLLREWQKQDKETAFPFSLFHPFYWVFVLAAALASFVIAMGIFFILPRIQLGYFSNMKGQKLQHVSGFSQNVSLGDVSSIANNTGVAMRVRVTSNAPSNHRFYWRGMAFDRYDGKTWSSTIRQQTAFLSMDSLNNFYNGRYTTDPSSLIKQEFYMEPLDTRVIFGQDRIVMVNGGFRAVTRDANQTLTGMSRPDHYEVYSRINEFNREHFKVLKPLPENIQTYYLQVPPLSSEFHDLSVKFATEKSDTVDRIVAINKYLQENFAYTTYNLPLDEKDPIAEFLFRRKAGSCEFFATSMVLLLRDTGIPARLVTGYLEGEYNDISNFYLVRQTDAHAWTEVYLNGQWYPVDPSPRPIDSGSGSLFDFSKLIASVSFFWDRYILIFSGQDQLNVITAARERYGELARNFKSGEESLPMAIAAQAGAMWKKNRYTILIALVLIAAISATLRFYIQRARTLRLLSSPVLFYQRTLFLLQQKGFVKLPQTTPSEFVESIRKEIPGQYLVDLSLLTTLFYQSRFGNHHLTEDEMAAVKQSLNRLEQL